MSVMPCDAFMKLREGFRIKTVREDSGERSRSVRRTANSQDVPRDGSIDWGRLEQLASDDAHLNMFSPSP